MYRTALRPRSRSARFAPVPALAQAENAWHPEASLSRIPAYAAAVVQPKLKIGAVDDPAELAADRAADAVMRMPDSAASAAAPVGGAAPGGIVQRKCASCSEDESEPIRRKEATAGATAGPAPAAPPAELGLGPGRPLPAAERAFFEPRFGRDLSAVRIHTDVTAGLSAKSINARAYTLGSTIAFGNGEYEPQTESGRRLIAHELAHTVQQGNQAQSTIQRQEDGHIGIYGGVPDFLNCHRDDLERDADTPCCSSTTLAIVPGLYSESRVQTDRALGRLRSGARMDSTIARHFGSAALSQRQAITDNLQRVRDELDRESSHRILCRIARSGSNSIGYELMGYVDPRTLCSAGILASARIGPEANNIVTLCVGRDGRPSGGWQTLLHEVVHRAGVGDLPGDTATPAQVAAGEVETYEGRDNYPNPAPFALRNADSYSSFVRDVGAESWSEESNPAAFAPRVEAGPALSLDSATRPGLMGGLSWTPLGRDLQMTVGARALWLPRLDGETAAPTDLRAYAGAELGLRWVVGGSGAQFVLDVAGGGGPYVTVDQSVDPALSARLGVGARFGGPAVGFGIGADFMRLFHLQSGHLVGDEATDWFGGLMLRGHWGGTSAGTR